MTARVLVLSLALGLGFAPRALAAPVEVDRVLLRWHVADPGQRSRVESIFERELAFEARIEALASGAAEDASLTERHVRAALNRHVAEGLLASLPLDPAPTSAEVEARAKLVRSYLLVRVGDEDRLERAAEKEGISDAEIGRMIRRSARASLYLERMVAPQIAPTQSELVDLHKSGATPFSDRPFTEVEDALGRWVTADRLTKALEAYYQKARNRIVVVWTKK